MDPQASGVAHAVLFPFPEQGHITPLLQLALHLASTGAIVTFVNTEQSHHRMIHAHLRPEDPAGLPLRFVTISDGVPQQPILSSDPPSMFHLLQSLPKQGPALETLIRDLEEAAGSRVSCLIFDAFLPWTGDVARKLQIQSVVFWASSATRLCVNYYTSGTPFEASRMDIDIPGVPFSSAHLAALSASSIPSPVRKSRMEAVEKADCVLVNTFEGLEAEAIAVLRGRKIRVRAIGPLCLGAGANEKIKGSLIKEDEGCMEWLEGQEERSVVYISFGSKVSLEKEQMEHLAMGIEASNKPYLWVVRGGEEHLPRGFRERTRALGKIVLWAPQERVLAHPSVGAFLTHCGWNSSLEALVMGVPMLCRPVFADQPTNRVLLEYQLRIAKGLPSGSKVASAHDVASTLQEVMGDTQLRQRATLLARSARFAMHPGGSSHSQFLSFIQDLPGSMTVIQDRVLKNVC